MEYVKFEKGELRAVGYVNGQEVTEFVRNTPKEGAKLVLRADYNKLTADGSDFTQMIVELQDENGTVLPYDKSKVKISVSDLGTFVGEEEIELEGGHVGFIVQSKYNCTGVITCTAELVDDASVKPAECQIEVTDFDKSHIVPESQGYGDIAANELVLKEINDTVVSGNKNKIKYVGDWKYGSEVNCYESDNHYSDVAGAYCEIIFEGTKAKFYGSKAPAHGIFAVSVDGGEEVIIDCYNTARTDNIALFETDTLPEGSHVIKIRVTGENNIRATGKYINVDRVVID